MAGSFCNIFWLIPHNAYTTQIPTPLLFFFPPLLYPDPLRHRLESLAESITKGIQPKSGNGTEHHGHRLAELDGAGKGSAAEDDGGQEAELDAVGLVLLDAVAAEAVCLVEASAAILA